MEDLKDYLSKLKTDDFSVLRFLIKGYLILTVLCFILLLIPFFQNGENSIIDHLFFAVSIVSTTGLAPANFAESYNFLGQFISLLFIQLGGVGYMALGSFIIIRQFDKLPKISMKLLMYEFSPPKRYPLLPFLYSVLVFTILIECIGALVLYYGFKDVGVDNPVWLAIFHSVSAFCTAGFSISQNSLVDFNNSSLIINTITLLSLLGSIGFIVLLDFIISIRKWKNKISLSTKIILASTFVMLFSGTLILYLSDAYFWESGLDGFKLALFQTMTAHTTVGFNSYDIGAFSPSILFILIILMIIGASPAGTGGGIKTTTITSLYAVTKSILLRRKEVSFFSKQIPVKYLLLSLSSFCFYLFLLFIGFWIMLLIDGDTFQFEQLLFESASALSTVGLSTGITADLSPWSKIIICCLMFIGRIGVLTFGFAMIKSTPSLLHFEEEDIAL